MDKSNLTNPHDLMVEKLSGLSSEEFLDFGSDGLSYIKSLKNTQGIRLYALHSADGSHIATGQDMAAIHDIAIKNQLVPVVVQ